MASTVIAPPRHRLQGRAPRLTIDLDPTDAPTQGQHELAFFTGHDDTGCDVPRVATLPCHDEADP